MALDEEYNVSVEYKAHIIGLNCSEVTKYAKVYGDEFFGDMPYRYQILDVHRVSSDSPYWLEGREATEDRPAKESMKGITTIVRFHCTVRFWIYNGVDR